MRDSSKTKTKWNAKTSQRIYNFSVAYEKLELSYKRFLVDLFDDAYQNFVSRKF